MHTEIRIVQKQSLEEAQDAVNTFLEEYEKKGYTAEILNLTPVTPQAIILWRFVLMFSQMGSAWPGGPPVEDQQ